MDTIFKIFLILVSVYLLVAIPLYLADYTIVETVCRPVCVEEGFDLILNAEWVFVDGTKCSCYESNQRYSKIFLIKDNNRTLLETNYDWFVDENGVSFPKELSDADWKKIQELYG